MGYFSTANLKEWYDKAFEEYRKTVMKVWFGPAVLILIGVFAVQKTAKVLLKKRRTAQ
jgi:hypothetical protein